MLQSGGELKALETLAGQLSAEVYEFIEREILPDLDWRIFDNVLRYSRDQWAKPPFFYTDVSPALACHAAGGDPFHAVPLAAAWLLNTLAGRILDDWQDNEGAQRPWMNGGTVSAVPIGLFAIGAANSAFSHLQVEHQTQSEIFRAFGNILALSARAQSADLNLHNLTVERYFAHIAGKTSVVFATAAWAGALAAESRALHAAAEALYDFGLNLGMAIQIADDCDDLASTDLRRHHLTLPVIYALSQKQHAQHTSLVALLNNRSHENRVEDVMAILTEMGALEWSMRVGAVYRARALAALEALPPENRAPLSMLVVGEYESVSQ